MPWSHQQPCKGGLQAGKHSQGHDQHVCRIGRSDTTTSIQVTDTSSKQAGLSNSEQEGVMASTETSMPAINGSSEAAHSDTFVLTVLLACALVQLRCDSRCSGHCTQPYWLINLTHIKHDIREASCASRCPCISGPPDTTTPPYWMESGCWWLMRSKGKEASCKECNSRGYWMYYRLLLRRTAEAGGL
jgi:hypothetical protein